MAAARVFRDDARSNECLQNIHPDLGRSRGWPSAATPSTPCAENAGGARCRSCNRSRRVPGGERRSGNCRADWNVLLAAIAAVSWRRKGPSRPTGQHANRQDRPAQSREIFSDPL